MYADVMLMRSHLGHDLVKQALVAAHARGTLHHAYLFTGPSGVGKKHLACALASLVNCSQPIEEEDGQGHSACGECRACQRMQRLLEGEERTHPDVVNLALQSDERAIKIERLRDTLRVVPYPPIEARVRFVIIDPIDALTVPAANALLKTLEEPPSTTQFILLSERPDALLPTIRSRCQVMSLGRLSDGEVREGLLRQGIDETLAARVAPIADGSIGDALKLLDDPIMAERDAWLTRLISLPIGRITEALQMAADLADQKASLPTFFDLLRRIYRDALVVRVGGQHQAVDLSMPELREGFTDEIVKRYGVEAILKRIELIDETQHGLASRNLNLKLSLERLLIGLSAGAGREGLRGRPREQG